MKEEINHPEHYGGEHNPYEVIKVIEAWGLDKNFCMATVLKYIGRAGKKDGEPLLKDLQKAKWYLDREIGKLEWQQLGTRKVRMRPKPQRKKSK
jgi:hypothetical protein